jgi:hypothetical protein
MGNLFNALNGLKTNIFGGAGNTGSTTPILRKSAIEMADTSPTSIFNDDPFQFAHIAYPRDVTNDRQSGHYMLFYVNVQNSTKYKYDAASGKEIGTTTIIPVKTKAVGPGGKYTEVVEPEQIIENTGDQEAAYQRRLAKISKAGTILTTDRVDLRKGSDSGGRNQVATGMSSYHNTTSRITDSIALYLPPNVQDSTSAAYNGFATGIVGMAAAGGANLLDAMQRNDFEGAANSIVSTAKTLTQEGLKKTAVGIVEAATQAEGTNELIGKAFGQADNPYMEVLFDKMALRTFTYNFTFAPRNTDERDDVQKIIQMFRFHMSPELKGQNNRFLTLPSTFDIHYMYQMSAEYAAENHFYNKIATCVLESCNVDYTPGGVKSFADGSPTQITMALQFKETELLTKERVNEGF